MRLATKYRPGRFGEVSGQRAVVGVLHRMAQRRNMPPAMLFHGAYGSGKTTCARILAAALNCDEDPGPASSWPCGACVSCKAVADGSSLDVIEVDAARFGTVEKAREIVELVQYGTPGRWRVVIFDECQSMSRDAVNHMLKTIEEPPPGVLFVFVTTEKDKLLPTLPSRCTTFAFTRLPVAVIRERLAYVRDAEGITISDELLTHLADRAQGVMRNALTDLGKAASVGIPSLAAWQELHAETDFAPALLSAAAQGSKAQAYAELDKALLVTSDYASLVAALASCLRDVLVLQGGGTVTAQGDRLAARKRLAQAVDSYHVVQAMRVLWDLQVRVAREDRQGALDLAVARVSEVLCPTPKPEKTASNGNGYHVLTPQDLAQTEGFKL